MCCLRTTDGRRNGRRATLQEQRAARSQVDQAADLAPLFEQDEWVGESCEGCWEAMAIAACDEHPPLAEPAPLRVPLAEMVRP